MMLKKPAAAVLAVSLLTAGAAWKAPSAEAADQPITITINEQKAATDVQPYIKQGATMVPLSIVAKLPGVTANWNNTSKTVTVKSEAGTVKLISGQGTATVNGKPVRLSVPSEMLQGRIMVPLRFVSEASGAGVAWNQSQRTAQVGKASAQTVARLDAKSLATGRNAALTLPRLSSLPRMLSEVSTSGLVANFYFPKGRSDLFFVRSSDVISAYKVRGAAAFEVWNARLKLGQELKSGRPFPFLPYALVAQNGEKPPVSGTFAAFSLVPSSGEVSYRLIAANGDESGSGQQKSDGAFVVEIPAE